MGCLSGNKGNLEMKSLVSLFRPSSAANFTDFSCFYENDEADVWVERASYIAITGCDDYSECVRDRKSDTFGLLLNSSDGQSWQIS